MKKVIAAVLTAAFVIGVFALPASAARGSGRSSTYSDDGCNRSLSWGQAESSTYRVNSSQYPYCD